MNLVLSRDQYFELEKIGVGAFSPLTGFMTEEECHSVVNTLRLPNGKLFPLPILLDINKDQFNFFKLNDRINLIYHNQQVGFLTVTSLFQLKKSEICDHVFQTNDINHPGVYYFLNILQNYFVGGPIEFVKQIPNPDIVDQELSPEQSRQFFQKMGWKTIAGFQTRNVPHQAHEYLQRLALEMVDGLFIQPLIGKKKTGDYTPEAIERGYQSLIQHYYPQNRVLLSFLTTVMRYAGPREALFHALIRKNYGCTHFIVGRDHAGVGSYYGKYEAQILAKQYESELGIKILSFSGPFYCIQCQQITTENSCGHFQESPTSILEIAGTDIRRLLIDHRYPSFDMMRKEVIDSLRDIENLFINENIL